PCHPNIQQKSVYGTPGYAPPEQYAGQVEPRSDIYALAATLYHLVTNEEPIQGYSFPLLDQLDRFGDILRSALHHKVTERPSATQFREQLATLAAQIEQSGAIEPAQAPAQ